MLKQLIIATFSWKATIIYSKGLYLILNVQILIQNYILTFLTCVNLHMIEKPLKYYQKFF